MRWSVFLLIFISGVFGSFPNIGAQTCVEEGGTQICTMAAQLPPKFWPWMPPWAASCSWPTPQIDPKSPYAMYGIFETEGGAANFLLHNLSCDMTNLCDAGVVFPIADYVGIESVIPGFNPELSFRTSVGYEWDAEGKRSDGTCYAFQDKRYTMYKQEPIVCPPTFSRLNSTSGICIKPAQDGICPIGHPIKPGFGSKLFSETDYSGASGSIDFLRSYSSAGYNAPAEAVRTWSGLLGRFWQTSFDARLFVVDGSPSVAAGLVRPDGSIKYFHHDGSEYPHFVDAPVETLSSNPDGTWTFISGNDRVESYDSQGRLVSIFDKKNLLRVLTYDVNNNISMIRDSHGRVLNFVVTDGVDSSRTVLVTAPDGGGYAYEIDQLSNLRRVTYPDGHIREYLYEDPVFLNAITGIVDKQDINDAAGVRYETITYDIKGRATASYLAPDSAGGSIDRHSFVYAANSTVVTDALNQQRTLTFSTINGVRNLAAISLPCASCGGSGAKSIAYDPSGYPDIVTDFNGTVTDHDYDTRGLETKRIEASNASGTSSPKRTIETQWHADFRVPVSRTTKNASGTLEARTTWSYNTRGQATARCEIDPADATAMAYACSATAAPPAAAKVRRTVTTYCEPADVTAGTCPLVGLVTSVNGARPAGDAGMAAGQDDRTTYTYYPSDDASCASNGACPHRKGDLWKLTNALGQVTTYATYDKNGRVTRTQDANGTVTDVVYHVRGWLTDRIVRASTTGTPGAGDATTHIDYDAVGNVKKVIQPDGAFLAYTYDDAHRLIRIADNLSNTIDYCPGGAGSAQCLDAAGNRRVEQVKDPSGTIKRALSRSYNALSQLVRLNNAAGSAVEQSQGLSETGVADGYDGNGNRVRVQDGLGIATRQRYDGLNRLVETLQNDNGSDPATTNASTGYVYDTRDNLRQVTDPDGLNTVYDYDGLNNLTGLHSPDTGDSSYTVDLAGNRRMQTDARGVTSSYAYDALNRLTGIGYPTASLNVGYAYDQSNAVTGCAASSPLGRLTTMSDASGSTTYCYDRRGNVTRKKQVTGGTTLTTDYAYTVADRLASITYPSGAIVAYARDTLGRVTAVTWKANAGAAATTVVSNASYYPFGPLNVLTYGNGRTLSKGYDQDYAIDYVLSSVTGGLALNLDVDVMGNIVSAVKPGDLSRGPTPIPTHYVYDPLYRLKDVQQPLTTGTLESYTYNKTGDRLSAQLDAGPVTSYTYAAGSHRLASVGGVARTYNANGNTQTGTAPSLSLGYDARNRLNSATKGSLVATYVHNGRGERVSKGVSSGGLGSPPTLYSYDESGRLLSEYGGTGVAQAEYVYLDGAPIAVVKSGSLSYIETDHLGTPRVVADPATNAARWAWNFFGDTFGADAPDPSPGGAAAYTLNLRFPGQYYDAETGFYYNYRRDYESFTGRYLESDPVGFIGGISAYAYVGNSPLRFFDPRGLELWQGCVDGTVGPYGTCKPPEITSKCSIKVGFNLGFAGGEVGISHSKYRGVNLEEFEPEHTIFPDFGLGIKLCCKPDSPCEKQESPPSFFNSWPFNDPQDELSIGFRRLGLSISADNEVCFSFGPGIGVPFNSSQHHGNM